jgi:O-antigen/teichoic acid export membrane protein
MQIFERILNSRLAQQFLTLLGGRLVAAGIQAVSIYFLARWSKIEDFGMFSAALGLAVTLQAGGDAGATTFIIRETAARGVTRNVAYAELLSRLVVGFIALFGILIILLLGLISGSKYLALLPLAGWIAFDRSSDIRSAIARGLGDVRIGTTNIVSRRVLQLTLFALAYWFGIATPWAYSLSLLCGSALVLAAMWCKLPRPPAVPLRKTPLKHAFLRCWPYWVHSTATQLRNIDTVIVAVLSGSVQAAYYGIGARLMTPLRMVPATLAAALLPHLIRRGGSGHKDIAFGTGVAILISIPYLILVAISPWVITHLGAEFSSATLPLQIMCLGLAGTSFISIFNAILQARNQAQLVAKISIINTLLLLILVTGGTLVNGASGAAIGFMIGTLVQAVMVFFGVKKSA